MHLSKRGRRVLAAAAAATLPIVLVGSRSAAAANLYWDINGTADGSSANTLAAGAWTTPNVWNSDPTGGATGTLLPWSNANGDTAIFSAGTNATGAFTVSGNATAGGLVIEEGAVNLTGTLTLGAGPITVQSGATLVTNSSLRIATTAGSIYTLNGGTLRTTNATTAGSFVDIDSTIVLNGGGTIDYTVANALSIINPTTGISGTGPLTKAGVGVIGLAGAATHTGGTVINEGELRIRTSNNRLPTAGAVTVNSPGILNLNGLSQQIGSLSGTGNVGTGAGTLTIDGSASTTFDGAVKNIANAGASGVSSGSGRIVKSGSGVITFNGLNDISGSVTLNAGGITVGPGGALAGPVADLVVNGGTLTLNNAAQTMENVSGSGGTIVLGTGHAFTTDPSAGAT